MMHQPPNYLDVNIHQCFCFALWLLIFYPTTFLWDYWNLFVFRDTDIMSFICNHLDELFDLDIFSCVDGRSVMPYNIKLVLPPKIGLVLAKNLWNFRMFTCNRVEILYEYMLNKTILCTYKGPDRTSWRTVRNCY